MLGDLPIGVPPFPSLMTLHDLRATWGNTKVLRFCQANPDTICFHDVQCPGADTCTPAPLEPSGYCRVEKDMACSTDGECPGSDYCIRQPLDNEEFTGARVKASLLGSDVPLDVGVFQGRICSREPLEAIDAQAAEFITFHDGRFGGAYIRGGVTFPIVPGSCVYNVKVGADVGIWATSGDDQPDGNFDSVGALVSGSASGKLACLAGLRGQVTTSLELFVDGVGLGGGAFGVVGAGLDCDPETWDSVQRGRDNRWCATTDGQASIVLRKGKWDPGTVGISGIH